MLRYLVGAARLPAEVNRTFDIGGPDVLTYREMMSRYATVAGLPKRRVVPVPVLTPRLSAHWVNVVTPVPKAIAKPLIDSLVHEVVCREQDILRVRPGPAGGPDRLRPRRRARAGEDRRRGRRDAVVRRRRPRCRGGPAARATPSGRAARCTSTSASRSAARTPRRCGRWSTGIGGERGWYSFPLAWSVRGWLDRLVGGVGLRRGRRDPDRLHVGDALDWWRVEEMDDGDEGGAVPEPGVRLLRLRAEMRVPGRAWLEMSVAPGGAGSCYRQRAVFLPRGLVGHLYWWSVAPFHGVVFGGMVRNITRTAERASAPAEAARP